MDDIIQHGPACLRKGRYSIPNQIYLITAATNNRTPVFKDWKLARLVVHTLRRYHGAAHTLCYVIMPDHLHWLMQLKTPLSLSQVVAGVQGASSREIQRIAKVHGPIWQSGFHDHALRSEKAVLPTARYIVANPLRAGLVKRIGDYPLWDAVWL